MSAARCGEGTKHGGRGATLCAETGFDAEFIACGRLAIVATKWS
jgi:hypothetical protein